MIEVFRRRKRFYLVFEYLDHTLLDELEGIGHGLGWELSKRHIYQVLRGLSFCHNHNVSEKKTRLTRKRSQIFTVREFFSIIYQCRVS